MAPLTALSCRAKHSGRLQVYRPAKVQAKVHAGQDPEAADEVENHDIFSVCTAVSSGMKLPNPIKLCILGGMYCSHAPMDPHSEPPHRARNGPYMMHEIHRMTSRCHIK